MSDDSDSDYSVEGVIDSDSSVEAVPPPSKKAKTEVQSKKASDSRPVSHQSGRRKSTSSSSSKKADETNKTVVALPDGTKKPVFVHQDDTNDAAAANEAPGKKKKGPRKDVYPIEFEFEFVDHEDGMMLSVLTSITGANFKQNFNLQKGMEVKVVREPSSTHDYFAIKITVVDKKEGGESRAGYIPREFCRLLSKLIDNKDVIVHSSTAESAFAVKILFRMSDVCVSKQKNLEILLTQLKAHNDAHKLSVASSSGSKKRK